MNTLDQQALQSKREWILTKLASGTGEISHRIQQCIPDIAQLGKMLNTWIDNMAVKYRDSGMTIDEWFDDIQEWLQNTGFRLEELDNKPLPNGKVLVTMVAFLSGSGDGRYVMIKFTLIK